jgi:hypothetical protein
MSLKYSCCCYPTGTGSKVSQIRRKASRTIIAIEHFLFHDLFYGPKNNAFLLYILFFQQRLLVRTSISQTTP